MQRRSQLINLGFGNIFVGRRLLVRLIEIIAPSPTQYLVSTNNFVYNNLEDLLRNKEDARPSYIKIETKDPTFNIEISIKELEVRFFGDNKKAEIILYALEREILNSPRVGWAPMKEKSIILIKTLTFAFSFFIASMSLIYYFFSIGVFGGQNQDNTLNSNDLIALLILSLGFGFALGSFVELLLKLAAGRFELSISLESDLPPKPFVERNRDNIVISTITLVIGYLIGKFL